MSDRDDLLPNSATARMRAASETSARLLDADTDIIRRARDPLHCPVELLPMLAWERSVDRWSSDEDANRAETDGSFETHVKGGSPTAIEIEIQRDTGANVRLEQWFEYGGVFPRFRVLVAQPRGPWSFPAGVRASALRQKNVRDVLERIASTAEETGVFYVGASLAVGRKITITPLSIEPPVMSGSTYIGATLGASRIITIQPLRGTP